MSAPHISLLRRVSKKIWLNRFTTLCYSRHVRCATGSFLCDAAYDGRDGNQEVVAAAFHIKCNFPVVTNDDGTDVEAVWSHRVMAMVLCGAQ
mgnify:CR=1 FL=1